MRQAFVLAKTMHIAGSIPVKSFLFFHTVIISNTVLNVKYFIVNILICQEEPCDLCRDVSDQSLNFEPILTRLKPVPDGQFWGMPQLDRAR